MKKIFLIFSFLSLFLVFSSCNFLNYIFYDNVKSYEEYMEEYEKEQQYLKEHKTTTETNQKDIVKDIVKENKSTITSNATVTIPNFAHMYKAKDFNIPSNFSSILQRASKFAYQDRINGIKTGELINLIPSPTSTAEIIFMFGDFEIYYGGKVILIPNQWNEWIIETYSRVVGAIQFLGENTSFTAASLSWDKGFSFVPLAYILKIRLNDSYFYNLILTSNYQGSITKDELKTMYKDLFMDYDSNQWLGLIVIYAVFYNEKYIKDYALGVLYSSLQDFIPSKNVFLILDSGL